MEKREGSAEVVHCESSSPEGNGTSEEDDEDEEGEEEEQEEFDEEDAEDGEDE